MNERVQDVTRLHRKAMEFADESRVAKLYGDLEKYLHYTRLALEREAAAADMMVDEDVEPTRSVLHRSAATLAWRCEEYDRSKRLIYRALAGNPPPDIEEELNDLLGRVKFAVAGIQLTKNQLLLSLEGTEVGHGTVNASAIGNRIPSVEALIQIVVRARARLKNVQLDKLKPVGVYLDAVGAGSFNITLRIGNINQISLPGLDDFDGIAEPLLQKLEFVDRGDFRTLQQVVSDPEDYCNFLKAVEKLAPDGERISSVNLQARIDERLRAVHLRRSQIELSDAPLLEAATESIDPVPTEVSVRKEGMLKVANLHKKSECILITDNEETWTLEGSEELITTVGKEYLNERVIVAGKRMKRTNLVKRIRLISESDIEKPDQLL